MFSYLHPTNSEILIVRLIIPIVFNKLIRVECMYLSNTTLFDGTGISSIYYVRYNYMFQRLTMAIFRLYMKYLVSSYTRQYELYRVGRYELRWTRDLVCVMEVGRRGYMGLLLLYIYIYELIIVRSMVSYYVWCRNYMYIYILTIYIYNVQYYTRI